MTGQTLTQFLDRPLLDVALDVEAFIADVKQENEEIRRARQGPSREPPPWNPGR
jgi:hypothetical protein